MNGTLPKRRLILRSMGYRPPGAEPPRKEHSAPAKPHAQFATVLLRYAVLFAVALYLLFCHGCHGDEDNELFAKLPAQVANLGGTP